MTKISLKSFSVKTQLTLTITAVLSLTLIFNNIIFYQQSRQRFISLYRAQQNLIATANKSSFENFMNAINQSSLFLISDQTVGELLSISEYDEITKYDMKRTLESRFLHCTNTMNEVGGNSISNYLFVNKDIPLANEFPTGTLVEQTGELTNIYSNSAVENDLWYQKTLERNKKLHIFIHPSTNQLCFARKLESSYYNGRVMQDGIGVMVTKITLTDPNAVFNLTPLSANCAIVLMNEFSDILYTNRPEAGLDEVKLAGNGDFVKVGKKKYITDVVSLRDNLTLKFFTPESDISRQLFDFQTMFFFGLLMMLVFAVGASWLIIRWMTNPITKLSHIMENTKDTSGKLDPSPYADSNNEIGTLYQNFYRMIDRIDGLTEEKRKVEIRALQAQISPHFLYNAMDAVSWMAVLNDQPEIVKMLSAIANILRYSVSDPNKLVSLNEELSIVNDYFEVRKQQYGDKIHLILNRSEPYAGFKIPKFSVQPLVENALIHGLNDSLDTLTVEITVDETPGGIVITVSDSGKGADPDILNKYLDGEESNLKVRGGIGIKNVNDRLKSIYGPGSGLRYARPAHGKFEARITIVSKL